MLKPYDEEPAHSQGDFVRQRAGIETDVRRFSISQFHPVEYVRGHIKHFASCPIIGIALEIIAPSCKESSRFRATS